MAQSTDLAPAGKEFSEGREAYEAALTKIAGLYQRLNAWVAKTNNPGEELQRKRQLFDAVHGGFQTAWDLPPDNLALGQNCTLTFSHHQNIEGSLYVGFEHDGQRHSLRFRWLGLDEFSPPYVELDKSNQVFFRRDGVTGLSHFGSNNEDEKGNHPRVIELGDDGIVTAKHKGLDYDPSVFNEMHRLCHIRDTLRRSFKERTVHALRGLFNPEKYPPIDKLKSQIQAELRKGYRQNQIFTSTPYSEVLKVLETFIVGLEQALPDLEAVWESTGDGAGMDRADPDRTDPQIPMLTVSSTPEVATQIELTKKLVN